MFCKSGSSNTLFRGSAFIVCYGCFFESPPLQALIYLGAAELPGIEVQNPLM